MNDDDRVRHIDGQSHWGGQRERALSRKGARR